MTEQIWKCQLMDYLTSGSGRDQILDILREKDVSVFYPFEVRPSMLCSGKASDAVSNILFNPETALPECDKLLVQAVEKVVNVKIGR